MIYNYFAYFFLPNEFIDKSLIYILDMAFKPRINWMEISGLLVGVFFTVSVMVFAIVLYAKLFSEGMIGVEEYRLHSTFTKAFGLHTGTKVQISGVDVGQIGEMEIGDNGEGVKMEFVIRKQYQNLITDSAQVFAIRDQNLISARVINIDIRRGKGRVLQDGDSLQPGEAQDIETVIETANQLLGRVNELIDAADTLVSMALDTGTTIGALFGSRLLYDNLNRQLNRLDDITFVGKKVLFQASGLFDTMQVQVPVLLGKVDGIADNVSGMMTELQPMPQKLDNLLGNVDGMMGKRNQIFVLQWLEDIDLTTGQQGGNDFERGVLRRGTDEGDDALFHRSQQRVLLALRETVYLVDKQDGILLALGLVNHLAHLLHAAAYGTQRVEGAMQHVADDHGQGGLSDARRAPENHGRDAATLHQCAQHGSRPHKVLLPDVVVQVGGPQYFG